MQYFNTIDKWIAKRLGKSPSEISIAIERLERVGLLERNKNGILFDTTKGFSTDIREGLTSQAQQRFQLQSLENAKKAIEEVEIELRDNTSMTLAINTSDIPEAKQMIKEFRRRFSSKLEENQNTNEVYQLSISFVPVSKKGEF